MAFFSWRRVRRGSRTGPVQVRPRCSDLPWDRLGPPVQGGRALCLYTARETPDRTQLPAVACGRGGTRRCAWVRRSLQAGTRGWHDGLDQAAEPLELRMLGPLEAWRGAERLALGGQRQRSVLACLCSIRARRFRGPDRRRRSGGSARRAACLTTLQTYVFHLREVIEPVRGKGAARESRRHRAGRVPPGHRAVTVDAGRFEDAGRRRARSAVATDPRAPRRPSPTALAMWRGDVLSDLASLNGLVARWRPGWTELRAAATERGWRRSWPWDTTTGAGTLDDLVAQYPLREHLAAMRMLALYRAGRQADALAAYRPPAAAPSTRSSGSSRRPRWRRCRSGCCGRTRPRSSSRRRPGGDRGPSRWRGRAHNGSTRRPAAASGPRRRRSVAGLSRRAVAAIVAVVLVAGLAVVGSVLLVRRGGVTPLPGQQRGTHRRGRPARRRGSLTSAPSALVSAGGAVWAALESDDAVAKIDPTSRTGRQTVPRGRRLTAGGRDRAATTCGWPGSTEGVLTRVNMTSGTVVAQDRGGDRAGGGRCRARTGCGSPTAATTRSSASIPATEKADPPIQVGDGPDALALDGSTLWVANGRCRDRDPDRHAYRRAGACGHPGRRRARLRSPSRRPTSGWPTSSASRCRGPPVDREGAVHRRRRRPVVAGRARRSGVGDQPCSAGRCRGSTSTPTTCSRRPSAARPSAVAVVDGEVWAAAGASAQAEHRGRTLIWTESGSDTDDARPGGSGHHRDVRQPHAARLRRVGGVQGRPADGVADGVVPTSRRRYPRPPTAVGPTSSRSALAFGTRPDESSGPRTSSAA